MNDTEQRALLGLSLMAAFADGSKSDVERDRVRELVEGFKNPNLGAMALYRDVLLKKVSSAEFAAQLTTPEARNLAYEMALGVCEADDRLNDAERAYLAQLQRELGLGSSSVTPLQQQADEIASAAVPPVLGSAAATSAATAPVVGGGPTPADKELDSTILNHAILAGALELLPGSLATMAIIPLQMRLVYRIGQEYGHQLDRGHIGEFLAAAGIGMTSQVLEGYATKLMKGLLGSFAGGIGRGIAGAFTGTAMAFATTWAVGQLARRYYAGGRTLSGMQMRETFQSLVGQARGLQQQYLPQIQQRSRGLSLSEVMRMARGS
ncbi:MAG: DUF533 domain-containing protein [Verrucomicrobiales bacterium]|nr:DUF533 domain-containing protein [Verrucomicrobiales bacterium]